MSAAALLGTLRALGVAVAADGEGLTLDAPAGVLTPALLAELRAHKRALLAYLAAGPAVAWRVAAMRARLPVAGPLPFLVARETPRGAGGCLRCGEPIRSRTEGLGVCCAPCVHAAQLATAEYMHGGQPA